MSKDSDTVLSSLIVKCKIKHLGCKNASLSLSDSKPASIPAFYKPFHQLLK
jgi:hypothetical protein